MPLQEAEFIETELFLKYKTEINNIICGITKKGKYSYSFHTITTEEEKEEVKNSRKLLLEKLDFDNLIILKQTHSDTIHSIDSKNIDKYVSNPYITGDGLITSLKNVLIGVSTADCVPITFISEPQEVIGIVHAGWKGIKSKIHLKMLSEFEKLKISPKELKIIIGPHNRVCSYEVGNEMKEFFSEKYFHKNGNKIFLNLEKIILDELMSFGLSNINSLKLCSFCNNDLFYSYRKGENRGRNLSFVGIQA